MRKLYFLLPGLGGKFACGGLWAELKTLRIAQQVCAAEVVTYRQREPNTLFIDDLLRDPSFKEDILVLSWGFDVPKLAARLKSYNLVYHAHSAEYGFNLPASVPIITVSRNTMGYWGQRSPHALIYYLPNHISEEFHNRHQPRDLDVLVQARKSSDYLLRILVPALRSHCQVQVVSTYVEDLPGLFNRAKVYLYDSAEYWAQQGVTEGLGLQPLEALACGCQVFSSVNHGLSDYLDPGFNCQKVAGYSTAYDVQRILKSVNGNTLPELSEQVLSEYRAESITQRLQIILQELNEFFDHKQQAPATIPPLTPARLTQLKLKRIWGKVQQRYLKRFLTHSSK